VTPDRRGTGRARIDQHRVAEVIDAYAAWRAECERVRECYRRWSDSQGEEAARAFAACTSALDREERCAAQLDAILARLDEVQARPLLRELREIMP
jgi:DNA-binding IclR family transcriptional regulator